MILKECFKEYYNTLDILKVSETNHEKCVSLAKIGKDIGTETQQKILAYAVTNLVKHFNVGKMINANQVLSTVQLLLEDFYYLTVEDFKLCFNRAKKGFYGQLFDRIDGQIIYQWVKSYSIERSNFYEQMNTKKDMMKVKNDYNPDIINMIKDALKE